MSQYKDASLKNLLTWFVDARWAWLQSKGNPSSEEHAENVTEAIAGELNRRLYINQQHNQALIETLETLIEYFSSIYYPDYSDHDEKALVESLEEIKDKLQGSSHD